MGENTKIAWAHHTFNPWEGCTKKLLADGSLHESCRHCYAETRDKRHLHEPASHWGKGRPRWIKRSGWNEPLAWARKAAAAGERHRVFCASLGDILDEEIDTQPAMRVAFDRTMQLIRETARTCSAPAGWCPNGYDGADMECPHCGRHGGGLDWLLLSKRPERWRLIPEDIRPLVWLGTSAADQKSWDEMVPRLVAADGFAKRFVSLEPQVGPVDCSAYFGGPYVGLPGDVIHESYNFGLDWVIQGGESGAKARPFEIAWARDVRDQCKQAGVAYFLKQLGARPRRELAAKPLFLKDRAHGADPSEWPEDLRVQEAP